MEPNVFAIVILVALAILFIGIVGILSVALSDQKNESGPTLPKRKSKNPVLPEAPEVETTTSVHPKTFGLNLIGSGKWTQNRRKRKQNG